MSLPLVVSVHSSDHYSFSKLARASVTLVPGLGIEGDVHAGKTVKHRSRMERDPSAANLRQVHLIHFELLEELRSKGFDVAPGAMGENISTRGIDLLSLPRGCRLAMGRDAVLEVTGLRNPCTQLDGLQNGLMEAVLERDPERGLIRKCGIMAVVIQGGVVHPGDVISMRAPAYPHEALKPV